MGAKLKISSAGLDLLKAYESFNPDVYLDQAGKPTIYWGHLIRAGERFNHTRAEGDEILTQDLGWAEDCVNAWVTSKVDLLQREFDALTCFTFNAGAKPFQTSTLRFMVLAGKKAEAAEQFLRWDKEHDAKTNRVIESMGLKKRRTAERALFLGLPWSPP
jgi:lysozyme